MIKLFDFYSSENAKRKEQEALAEQRRAQREAEELKKSKNGKKKSDILKILKFHKIFFHGISFCKPIWLIRE